jgi:hypothetical protein
MYEKSEIDDDGLTDFSEAMDILRCYCTACISSGLEGDKALYASYPLFSKDDLLTAVIT